MTRTILNEDILQAAVAGGSFYGGGGGGSPALGVQIGRLALGTGRGICMVDLADLPDDAVLLTVSAVGSPAGKGHHAGPDEYARAVELFCRQTGLDVAGLITNECGGLATVNGWMQSAATGIPIVDAPCNGRAHPTGTMGSMGLHLVQDYEAVQTVVGGSRKDGTYLEVLIRGSLDFAGSVVRQAAGHTGGLVAVARNPVTAAYARKHAAAGAIARCVQVGKEMLSARSAEERIAAVARVSGGSVMARGVVSKKELVSAGGFDTGIVEVAAEGSSFGLTFWNEYITLDQTAGGHPLSEEYGKGVGGREKVGEGYGKDVGDFDQVTEWPARLATFPDLIATLDLASGYPVSSADLREGQDVAVIVVPKSALLLGSGVKDPHLYEAVERTVNKEVIKYIFRD